MVGRVNYWRRIFKVYLTREKGYLSFWHERPALTSFDPSRLGPYYMTFADKADYRGPKDGKGVILFDYFFDIGRQYNPLAIAQYGLGHFNRYLEARDPAHLNEAKVQGEWLVRNLEENEQGVPVWKHLFPWHYKETLKAGWYSAHSQGAGISLLVRLSRETKDERYRSAAERAFRVLDLPVADGGVKYVDVQGNPWLEEYLVDPPTHILNGFLWALWGVWDYHLATGDERAAALFRECVATLRKNLARYDLGFWSRYDLSRQALPMVASPFYHRLHVVQLRAIARIAGESFLEERAERWERYGRNVLYRTLAFILKAVFKVFYF